MIKYLAVAGIVLLMILISAAGIHFSMAKGKQMKKEEVLSRMEGYFRQKVRKDPNLRNAYLLVHSDRLGIHLNLAEGAQADPQQPYFVASVGKMFTSALAGILVEKGLLSYEDPISKYLDPGLLNGLHIYKGTDYSGAVLVKTTSSTCLLQLASSIAISICDAWATGGRSTSGPAASARPRL
jgi:hypothetical protein